MKISTAPYPATNQLHNPSLLFSKGTMPVLLLLGLAVLTGVSARAQLNPYENRPFHYSLQYPKSWQLEEKSDGRTVNFKALNNGKLEAVVQVLIVDVPANEKGLSIKQLIDLSVKNVNLLRNPAIRTAQELNLDPYEGMFLDFTHSVSRKDSEHWVSRAIRKDDLYYIIRYIGNPSFDDNHLPLANSIFNSFAMELLSARQVSNAGADPGNRPEAASSLPPPVKNQLNTPSNQQTPERIAQNSQPAEPLTSAQPHPNVKYLDIDGFCGISNGVCVVYKGNKQALINMNGDFIVPWGKYSFGDCNGRLLCLAGLIKVYNPTTKAAGFINTKGKLIIPAVLTNPDHFYYANMCYVSTLKGDKNWYGVIDTTGKVLIEYKSSAALSDRLTEVHHFEPYFNQAKWHLNHNSENYNSRLFEVKKYLNYNVSDSRKLILKFGYVNRLGKLVIPLDFDEARGFSEGLAAVGKRNEFGELKWGYINKAGKEVIDYTFSLPPGEFHNGLALVTPKDKSDFDYAYINIKGEVKLRIGDGRYNQYLPLPNSFETHYLNHYGGSRLGTENAPFTNGYALWRGRDKENKQNEQVLLLDTTGVFRTFDEFINRPDLKKDIIGFVPVKYDDLGIYFHSNQKAMYGNDLGLIDYRGKVLFSPLFHSIEADFYSPYALGTIQIPPGERINGAAFKTGIIDKDGYFIMLPAKKSNW